MSFWDFLDLGGSTTVDRERERERERFFLSINSQRGVFIEKIRVEEDPVRTGRVSNYYNPQSWQFGLLVLLLLKSLHPDVRFE